MMRPSRSESREADTAALREETMIRVFKEHPEFGEFTRFDTATGRLAEITEGEFIRYLPEGFAIGSAAGGIQAIQGRGATVFVGEMPPTRTRFPRRVYFQITRNCNLRCPTCFMRSGKGGAHVPTSAALAMARFMGRNGLIEVRLTGGEPTTHPAFFDVLHAFYDEGVYVSVATNGMVDYRTLDALAEEENLWVICSVDGSRETHNLYRPGTFDLITGNMRYLKKRNPAIRLRLTTVLTKQNKGQMHELGQICRSLGAESITVIPLRPQVRDPAVLNDMVSAQEFRQVIEDLVAMKQRLGVNVTTTLETDYAGAISRDPVFRKRSSCAAGREGTNLDYDAGTGMFQMYGCSYSPASDLQADPRIRKPFVAGQFPADVPATFLDIWRDERAWTIFRDLSLKSDDCSGCGYYAHQQCTGSCPIQNVDYSGIDADGDVLAQLGEQIRHTTEWYCYKKVFGRRL